MNLKIKFLIMLCGALFLLPYGGMAQSDSINLSVLTFEQAAQFMKFNNYNLKQADNYILQKEQEVKAARGLYLPNISLSANYVVMSDDISLDMNPIKESITPLYETLGHYGSFSGVPNPDPNSSGVMPILPDAISTQIVRGKILEGLDEINATDWNHTIQKKQFGVINANFVMPIYTGGKINAANKAAKIELAEARTQKSVKQDELFCQLVERYYGLVLSNAALVVREDVQKTMNAHVNDAEKLKKYGMIADAEYLHAKVYNSEADREYKKTKRENKIINDAFLNTLSSDSIINVQPLSKLFYLPQINDLSYFLEMGNKQNEMLEMVQHKKELAHQGYQAEKAAYFPTIAAMGTYDIANKDLSPNVPEYMVGVGVNWSLFDGASRMRKAKAAKLRENQVDDYYAQTELDINMAIQKYYQELNMQLEQLHDLEQAFDFANEYYRIREKAFSEGMATTTEVADANLALAKVKIDKLQAIYKYDVALSKLLFYSGILSDFGKYQNSSEVIYTEI
ncbi:MAG: TolC family protein [Salinivirgaceae bacterium]|nr:TolC family protein [Salinivirgaceae bacterium]